MRPFFPILLTTIMAAAGLLSFSCAPLTTAGGSEIGNPSQITVMGQVVYATIGTPVSGADVRLRSTAFCKDTTLAAFPKQAMLLRNAVTDESGRFVLDSVDTGDYNIEINDGKSNAVMIPCVVRGASAIKVLPIDTVRQTTVIGGAVAIDRPGAAVYVQVYGLDRVARADTGAGVFEILDVPPGTFNLRIVSSSSAYAPVTVRQVRVTSGTATVIDTVRLERFSGWAHSRSVILNTAPSGADVAGTVHDFPILVRLTSPGFVFSQAQTNGEDIRFAKTDSTPLPYEIEQWDPVTGHAEVWIRVDTVFGNNGTQSILMFWGNPEAGNASNSCAVFGVDNRFIAAWHMDNSCGDATTNHHDGTNSGADEVAGIIGPAMKFDGSDSIKIAGLLGEPATVTLSGWVKTDTMLASGQEIITLGDAVLIRANEIDGYGTGGYARQYGDTAYTKVTSGLNIAKTGWRHVAFTFDNAAHVQSLYIDGVLVRTEYNTYAIDYSGVGSNTLIGTHGNGKKSYNNRGMIDEVRVGSVPRTADWIKLCYMNQRTDDRLVMLR
ncbi:MAG: DUF2341 domain-containing protein [Chitinispirillaceae bacterium]|nr:DUF2341 domain-containing protein [Chitinispirillaceae bacterium]